MANEVQNKDVVTLNNVEHLMESGKVDTVYRDLYLQRACDIISPILSHDEYLRLKRNRSELDEALKRSGLTVEKGDWAMARELALRIGTLRRTVEKDAMLLKLGEGVYEPGEVLVNPFSSVMHGLPGWRGPGTDEAFGRLTENLAALQQNDPAWHEFYAGRLAFFKATSTAELGPNSAVCRFDMDRMRREALQAVESGDVSRLDELLAGMGNESNSSPFQVQASEATTTGTQVDLNAPFPADAIALAVQQGFAAARMESQAEVFEYITSHAWQPTFQDRQLDSEGRLLLRDVPEPHGLPSDVAAQFKEFAGIFMLHPIITTGGTRYLPTCTEEEVLFEDFSEDDEGRHASDVLENLGLPSRRGLSRAQIEYALLRKGVWIVENLLGLDPHIFRLVCIPCDIYYRLGKSRHWGEHRLWTHFDGYQLMPSGVVRPLVGGDVRYGGIFDLCSIDYNDEREGVIVRFAVIRRERMKIG